MARQGLSLRRITAGPQPAWRWEQVEDPATLDRRAGAWNTLAHSGNGPLTADAVWTRCFWRAFGVPTGSSVHLLHRDDTLVAVVPVRRCGRLVRGWRAIANAHTPYWAPAVPDEVVPAQELLETLLRRTHVLDLAPLHSGGAFATGIVQAARARGLRVVVTDAGGDTAIDLFAPWEAFRRSLSSNLMTATPRKYRRLQRLGDVRFDVVRGGDQLRAILEECFALEAMGWKGRYGSPIRTHPATYRFYTVLATESAALGRFALYTLRLNERLIAFEYCLRAQRRIDMLKLSYAAELATYSPGNILRYLLLAHEIDQGDIDSYHLGQPSAWKVRWATRVEPLSRVRIYNRDGRGQLAYYTGPCLRAALKNRWSVRALALARCLTAGCHLPRFRRPWRADPS